MIKARIERLRSRLAEGGVDAMLVSQPQNRRYLTGFTGHDSPGGGTAGWLLVSPSQVVMVAGFLSLEQARIEAPELPLREVSGNRTAEVVAEVAREWNLKRIACEGNHLTYLTFTDLQRHLDGQCELLPVEGWLEPLRAVKDEDEIAAIRRAAEVTDKGFAHVLAVVRPGMSEREVAWEAEKHMREAGAEAMAFEVSVASGPNTSVPHHRWSDRPIRAGEPIWIDMGAQVDGYCADLTRSFCIGKADDQLRGIWDLVYRAQRAAIEGTRAGMTGRQADAIARDIISAAGYGPNFGHSLGHGVGLVVHERPRLSQISDDELRPGMVSTFEPGVYVEGWGGVRIEDLGVISENGVQLLSAAPNFLELEKG